MNKKHWINVYFNKEVSDKVIKDLLKNSYELVVASLTKRIRQDLEEDARENG
jgi:predicted DNA-binding protein (MmcQ/YjbR family)